MVTIAQKVRVGLMLDKPGEEANHAWLCNVCEEILSLT